MILIIILIQVILISDIIIHMIKIMHILVDLNVIPLLLYYMK